MTSPPYGVGKSYEEKGIEPWFATMRPVVANLCKYAAIVVWQLGDLYSTGGQFIEPTMAYSINLFRECGFRVLWIRVWEKPGINFGVGAYHLVTNKPAQQYEHVVALGNDAVEADWTGYEWITAFGVPGYRFVKRLSKADRKAWGYAGVWKINTVQANDDHPAMFPLELPERCIKMHSDPGDTVLEPFSGSGTTLIACERLGRKCRAVELDPKYVAVALERWSVMTGKAPVLASSEVSTGGASEGERRAAGGPDVTGRADGMGGVVGGVFGAEAATFGGMDGSGDLAHDGVLLGGREGEQADEQVVGGR